MSSLLMHVLYISRACPAASTKPVNVQPLHLKYSCISFQRKEVSPEVAIHPAPTISAPAPGLGVGGAESDDLEGLTEMSALQKQLLQKRSGRVALRTKKVLAMMEEETVIGDSNKARLLKVEKIEVRSRESVGSR